MVINKWYLIILLCSTWQMDAMSKIIKNWRQKKQSRPRSKSRSLNEKELNLVVEEPTQMVTLPEEELKQLSIGPSSVPLKSQRSKTVVAHSDESFKKLQRCASEQKFDQLKSRRQATDELLHFLFPGDYPTNKATGNDDDFDDRIDFLLKNADINYLDKDENNIVMRLIENLPLYNDKVNTKKQREYQNKVDVLKIVLEKARFTLDWDQTNVFGQSIFTLTQQKYENNKNLKWLLFTVQQARPSQETMSKYRLQQCMTDCLETN